MGGICSCLFPENTNGESNTQSTRLLSDKRGSAYGAYTAEAAPPTQTNGSRPTLSARQNRPEPDDSKEEQFTSSVKLVVAVSLEHLPSELGPLDKTFQDHAKLYNDQYESFKELRSTLEDFKGDFAKETAGIPTIESCLSILAQRCGGARLEASRGKNCIQLQYEAREVSEKCHGLPEDVLRSLELYNKINRLVKSLLEKTPHVTQSLQLVLEDERRLKLEVTKNQDLPPDRGSDALRKCGANINTLRKCPGYLDTVRKYTKQIFNEIVEGSKALLQEQNGGS